MEDVLSSENLNVKVRLTMLAVSSSILRLGCQREFPMLSRIRTHVVSRVYTLMSGGGDGELEPQAKIPTEKSTLTGCPDEFERR